MSQTRRRWAARALSAQLLLAVLVLAMASTNPAQAQTPGSVELVAQSSWVDDGGIFSIQVRVAGATPDSTVVLRVLSPWTERDDFLRQDLSENSTTLLELEPVVLGDAQQTSNEVLGLEFVIDGPNTRQAQAIAAAEQAAAEQAAAEQAAAEQAAAEEAAASEAAEQAADATPVDGDPDTADPAPPVVVEDAPVVLPALESDGGSAVYPIEVSLLDGDGNLTDSFLTSMIELPRQDLRPPLAVSIVLEAGSAATPTPDDPIQLTDDDLSELRVLSDAFAQHPSANMALSISPKTLLALAAHDSEQADQVIQQLQANLSSEQLLPNPFAELEEQAWFDAELTDELAKLYEAGDDIMIRSIGIEPDSSVMLLDRTIDANGLEDLAELGVQGAIVRPAQLTPLDRSIFPDALTTRFLIDGGDDVEPLPALVADGGLANHFTAPGGAVLNANRLLADLVLLSLQTPGARHSVVVNPPETWVADATFLNVMLGGLERVPAIRGSLPVDALADTEITPSLGIGTIGGPLHRQLNPPLQPASLDSFRTEYRLARGFIDSWSTVIGTESPSRERLGELLHLSTDGGLSTDERDAFIVAIYTLINDEREASITTVGSETVTLTGRDSLVPLVLENRLDSEASVLLMLTSEELDFPEGAELLQTLQPGPNRITIPISARASGDSPIRIDVLSPDGLIELGSSVVLVRTFAFSGVGIAIGIVAILVLLVWWLRHVRGTRDTIAPLQDAETREPEKAIGV